MSETPLSSLIAARMLAARLTDTMVARAMAEAGYPIGSSTVGSWRRGDAVPRDGLRQALADALGLDVGRLMYAALGQVVAPARGLPLRDAKETA